LLVALEQYAQASGYEWLYLDSKDDLKAALRFYDRHGYEPCERYNRNQQATVFLRKALHARPECLPDLQSQRRISKNLLYMR
jgi:hypothetical protein